MKINLVSFVMLGMNRMKSGNARNRALKTNRNPALWFKGMIVCFVPVVFGKMTRMPNATNLVDWNKRF